MSFFEQNLLNMWHILDMENMEYAVEAWRTKQDALCPRDTIDECCIVYSVLDKCLWLAYSNPFSFLIVMFIVLFLFVSSAERT